MLGARVFARFSVGSTLMLILTLIWIIRMFANGPLTTAFKKRPERPLPPPPRPIGPPPPAGPPGPPPIDLSDADAPFIGWPLQRLCSETTWHPGVVYICDNNSGGIGNIRNYIHTCLRYAIDAGAAGLVMPRIRKRSDSDLRDLFKEYQPFSYMFDEKHFRTVMAQNCPQMTIHDSVEAVPHARGEESVETITPKDMGDREGCNPIDQNRHTDRWVNIFYHYLNVSSIEKAEAEHKDPPLKPPSVEKPRLIRFNWGQLWDWQTYKDGPELYATFGSVLKFNAELIGLGRRVAEAIRSAPPKSDGRFLGVHLRSESDALGFWPNYEEQRNGYFEQARQKGFTRALLATGDAKEARKFADEALSQLGMRVYTSVELLSSTDAAHLQQLTWDQRAVVDFVALLECDFFVGVSPSSFSVFMAIKRHLRTGGLYTRPYKPGNPKDDGLSYIVGNFDKYWDQWLFMWDGMWP